LIPRLFWVPDLEDLDAARDRIARATRARFDAPVALWLRLYGYDARTALAFVASIRPSAVDAGVRILLAMRVDLALASGADGVHLPANGMSVAEARSLAPTDSLMVGASCHDARELERAADADYVTLSPVFAVPGKGDPLGLDGFRELARVAGPPVIALGGIDSQSAASVVRAGAHGVAVRRAIDVATDPHDAIRGFLVDVGRPGLR